MLSLSIALTMAAPVIAAGRLTLWNDKIDQKMTQSPVQPHIVVFFLSAVAEPEPVFLSSFLFSGCGSSPKALKTSLILSLVSVDIILPSSHNALIILMSWYCLTRVTWWVANYFWILCRPWASKGCSSWLCRCPHVCCAQQRLPWAGGRTRAGVTRRRASWTAPWRTTFVCISGHAVARSPCRSVHTA